LAAGAAAGEVGTGGVGSGVADPTGACDIGAGFGASVEAGFAGCVEAEFGVSVEVELGALGATHVSAVLPEVLPMLAVIVVIPAVRQFAASAFPAATVAPIPASLLVHVTRVVTSFFVPSLYMPVATKFCEAPVLAVGFSGAIVMLVRDSALLPLGKNAAATNAATTSKPPMAT
jgi:hypothetical protein